MVSRDEFDGFVVGDLLHRRASGRSVYLCSREGDPLVFDHLIVIKGDNDPGNLFFEQYQLLSQLLSASNRLDGEHENDRKLCGTCSSLGYENFFVEPVKSFRDALIFKFRSIGNLCEKKGIIIPIHKIISSESEGGDDLKIDLRSSVWILGKGIKALDFFYSINNINVGRVNSRSVWISPENHIICFSDLTESKKFHKGVPKSVVSEELSNLALLTLDLLGFNSDELIELFDSDELIDLNNNSEGVNIYRKSLASRRQELCYFNYILKLAFEKDLVSSADDLLGIHDRFYQLADSAWAKSFHEVVFQRRS